MSDDPQAETAGSPPSFEQALARLESIVRELEDGELGLAESLGRYEEGVALLKQCYGLLDRAQRRIELLSGIDAEGNPLTEPFDDRASLPLDEKAQSRSQRRSTAAGKTARKAAEPAVRPPTEIDEGKGLF